MLNLVFHDEFVITLQRVELGVLGPVQVRQYGLPVAIPGAKPRAVLTMLGLHDGSVVAADALIELLWGDEPPRTAVKAMQTHISALRRALGDGFVLTGDLSDLVFDASDDNSQILFGSAFGVLTDLETGPDGNLYGVSLFGNQIYRIRAISSVDNWALY